MTLVASMASLAALGCSGGVLDSLLDTVLDCVLDQILEELAFLVDVLPLAIYKSNLRQTRCKVS